jgi:hypothetical protein
MNMTNVRENIEDMLSQINKGDFESASETFQYVMTQKVSDTLESMKQDVGSSFMNTNSSNTEE